jgi:GNAT superfamily N-acetyltransferase
MANNGIKILALTLDRLHFIAETLKFDEKQLERLNHDFNDKYFYGIVANDQITNQNLGYLIYYYSYSTWENRVIYISRIYFDTETTFQELCEELLKIAQSEKCNRINFNVKLDHDAKVAKLFGKYARGMNLTNLENWNFFRMDFDVMKEFANVDKEKYDLQANDQKFNIKKFDPVKDSQGVCGLIRELSIYEKMENQFKLSPDELIRDFSTNPPFFSGYVVRDSTSNEMVAFAIYYFNYSLENGRGCYLEDLYVVDKYRGFGIGTLLWRKVVDDCLNKDCSFFEWACLDWNTSAIEFYKAKRAYNATEKDNLHLFRVTRENIYL